MLPLSSTKRSHGGVGEILDVLLICLLVLLNKSICGSPAAYKGAGFPSSIKKYKTEILPPNFLALVIINPILAPRFPFTVSPFS